MRFYNQQHAFYCGIDLHKKTMYLCIIVAVSSCDQAELLESAHKSLHTVPLPEERLIETGLRSKGR